MYFPPFCRAIAGDHPGAGQAGADPNKSGAV